MKVINDIKFKYTKTKRQQAEKIANWFVDQVLHLKDQELLDFYNLIYDELVKRGVLKDVRGCWNIYDSIYRNITFPYSYGFNY